MMECKQRLRTPAEVEAELNRIVSQAPNSQLTRLLHATWNAQQKALKYEEITAAVEAGVVPANWWETWHHEYSAWAAKATDEYTARARDGLLFLGDGLGAGLPGLGELTPGWEEGIARWITEHTGSLVVGISDTQQEALRGLVSLGVSAGEGVSPTTLAQAIRPAIGLTPRQSRRLLNDALALISNGELTPSGVASWASKMASRMKTKRATVIARTELAWAFNAGHEQAAHVLQDAVPEQAVVRQWWTQLDERVCPICGPLHGVSVGLDGVFQSPVGGPSVQFPPIHPQCRCVVLYDLQSSA